ncbi:MAG: hypothetical protein D6814_12740 [Calditrichaeota bacterium]|nr:MAG: hypothetical protein D6814_12740 [Calditrichota bacterium]
MGKINLGRVVIGGLVAGVVFNIGEFLLNGPILGEQWKTMMESLGLPQMTGAGVMLGFIIMAFVIGIATVWLYAAIRPRFGPGPKTAVYNGLVIWFLVWLWGFGGTTVMGIYPTKLVIITLIWGLFEAPLASLAGAWVYKEE